MKITFTTILRISLVFVGIMSIATTVSVYAQSKPTPPTAGQSLEIAPPVINLTADPGQTVKADIKLRDIASTKLVVTNEVNDFVANGEDGIPKILLNDDSSNPYSMKTWVNPLPRFTLVPKQIQDLPLMIKVPANASPGGYYSVVRFTGTPPELGTTGVSLSASLGSLILLRVNGAAKEKLEVAEFSVSKDGKSGSIFESTPLDFTERLKNSGNLHESPAGLVTITDMFGKTVATLGINQPPRNILPSSIRKFGEPLDQTVIGDKWLFGRYRASMSITYGANKQTLYSTLTFWVIPYKLVAIIVIALIVLFLVIRFALKRYRENILSQASRRRR